MKNTNPNIPAIPSVPPPPLPKRPPPLHPLPSVEEMLWEIDGRLEYINKVLKMVEEAMYKK